MAPSLASLLLFAVVAQGYETFEMQCTSPSTTVNFVSSADKRGTMDILFSCLFTLIACTWTVQHLNIPEQREGRDPGWLGNIKWASKRAWTSMKWMLFTILAPEFLLAKSLADLMAVKGSIAKLIEFAAQDGVPWTKTHSLFANMGGFVIRVDVDASESKFSAALSYSNPYHLVASDILALRADGILEKLPSITEEELNDKSKSDGLVRAVTVVQITWMIVQMIVRAYRHLAISQLEVSVLAFASCAIVIYGLNWEKPKGVQVPYNLMIYEGDIPESVLSLLGEQNQESVLETIHGAMEEAGVLTSEFKQPGSPLQNDVSYFEANCSTAAGHLGLIIGSIIFGAIHLAAWNFDFPTETERTIWRVASILCTSPAFVVFGLGVTFASLEGVLGTMSSSKLYNFCVDNLARIGWVLICFGYVVARLFMIVETFRTLFFLPPSAYITTWASNVPHIA